MKSCPNCGGAYSDDVAFCPRDGAPLRSAASLGPGAILRTKYEILGEIGRGGMGVVYRARHLLLNEEKAIKLLLEVGSGTSRSTQSFLSEALIMGQFHHPNIVRVEDADFTDEGSLFLVMELVQGESLQQRMSRGPVGWRKALEITAQVCAGLAAAHKKGIIHRDVKPQNLLIASAPDGQEVVKLIDFGIAKVREEAIPGVTGSTSTQTGVFMGTPEYASPEQAMGLRGSQLDAQTDIYSLGLVLFEMLTAAKPFPADTPMVSLFLRLHNEPVAPRELRPELQIPQAASDLVRKAVARDKALRYASAEEMLADVERVLRQEPVPAVAASQPPAPRKGTGAKWWIAGAAAFVAAALSTWMFHRRAQPIPAPAAASAIMTAPAIATAQATPADVAPPPVPSEKAEPLPAPSKSVATIAKTEIVSKAPPDKTIDTTAAKTAQTVSPPGRDEPVFKVNPVDQLKYVRIDPGKFTMGCSPADNMCSSDESPPHQVTLTKGFRLGQTEVTQAAYEHVTGNNPSAVKGPNLPVDSVNWLQASAYCKQVGMRLPTEAEWEYSARAGSSAATYGKLGQIAWWTGNSGGMPHDVAQKLPNGYGLFDMIGNATEWTSDWYAPYSDSPVTDPAGPAQGRLHVLRGGGWHGGAVNVRASVRLPRVPRFQTNNAGFRCAGE